jgi:lipopolysaccharide/colanic/teichoic acid biosynthesis glycosyltransferase
VITSDPGTGQGLSTTEPRVQTRTSSLWCPTEVRDRAAKRLLDVVVSAISLLLLLPVIVLLAIAIKLDSRGPVFFRSRRVGFQGRDLDMLKFRKMVAGATGPALTVADDQRFTRTGHFLAWTKLDEIPQLWHVLKGEMSLVGPRPEDPEFVAFYPSEYEQIVRVKPGATGLCQLAFAREGEILASGDPVGAYLENLLPQKIQLDILYASARTFAMDVRILAWTAVAVVLRREVAVCRLSGRLNLRRRPQAKKATAIKAPELT